MPRAHREIEIARSPADVFTYVADFSNDVAWRSNVIAMKPLGAATDVGGIWSRQIEVRKVPGKTVETEAVITVFEPGQELIVQRASGPVRPAARYAMSPHGAGTRLTFELDVALRGATVLLFPLVWLFLALAIRPAVRKDLARLKERLEQQPS